MFKWVKRAHSQMGVQHKKASFIKKDEEENEVFKQRLSKNRLWTQQEERNFSR